MKYSSTPRLINTIIFALFFLGFGFLAVYYGILMNPFLWITAGSPLGDVATGSIALCEMFGAVGFAGTIISCFGLMYSVKSLLKSNDDELVQKSFLSYIGLGYMLAGVFFLNAIWLYRLTTTNFGYDGIGFVIVVYLLATIVLMIATNVPLVKILGEEEDGTKTMALITGSFAAANLGLALSFLGPWLRNLAAGAYSNSDIVNLKYMVFTLLPLVSACLAFLATLGYKKAQKEGTPKKTNAFLFAGAVGVDGIAMIVAGVFSYLWQDKKLSFITSVGGTAAKNANAMEFTVVSIIIGSLLVIGAVVLAILTVKPPKLKSENAR
ncbi:MAG: hypothetical protein K6F32_03150 [Bacilli bacterium]|nr:hypothetical protein [Bacilli bacterium]